MKALGAISLFLINSKRHLDVASTSAVALCASSKVLLNKNLFNSISVGSLNLPPLPPGILHKLAVSSVHVSIIGIPSNKFSNPNLKNSAPIIFKSKLTLWPQTNFVFLRATEKLLITFSKSNPSFSANAVEIPCIFSES